MNVDIYEFHKFTVILAHLGVQKATSIQTFDFSGWYTSILHDLLKFHMNNIINNVVRHRNGTTQYAHKLAEVKAISPMILYNGDNKYTANDVSKMIEF